MPYPPTAWQKNMQREALLSGTLVAGCGLPPPLTFREIRSCHPPPQWLWCPTGWCYSNFWVKDLSWQNQGQCQRLLPVAGMPGSATCLPTQCRWELLP